MKSKSPAKPDTTPSMASNAKDCKSVPAFAAAAVNLSDGGDDPNEPVVVTGAADAKTGAVQRLYHLPEALCVAESTSAAAPVGAVAAAAAAAAKAAPKPAAATSAASTVTAAAVATATPAATAAVAAERMAVSAARAAGVWPCPECVVPLSAFKAALKHVSDARSDFHYRIDPTHADDLCGVAWNCSQPVLHLPGLLRVRPDHVIVTHFPMKETDLPPGPLRDEHRAVVALGFGTHAAAEKALTERMESWSRELETARLSLAVGDGSVSVARRAWGVFLDVTERAVVMNRAALHALWATPVRCVIA